MKKFLVIVLSVMFIFGTIGLASANGEGGGGDKMTVKDNNVILGHGNTGIQGSKNHHNTVIGGDVNVGTNAGGSIINRNNNSNSNSNSNKNTNTNLNMNTNKNTNTAKSTAIQGQGQKQSVENEITIEGDDYEAAKMHITGPGMLNSDAKLQQGKRFSYKTWGSVWAKVDFLTMKQAKKLCSKASDISVEESIMFENDFRTSIINKGKPVNGSFMGYLFVGPDDTDAEDLNTPSLEGAAGKRAMKLGATHMIKVGDDSGDVATGDSWNIGISGGASIITSGDGVAIAPNGGLGFGSASASNETIPAMVFELYVDPTLIKEKLSKRADDQSYQIADR